MEKFKTASEFLNSLSENQKVQVLLLQKLILEAEPAVIEHIKWNAPSYMLGGEDRVTFNVLNKDKVVKLVLHMGAKRQENKKSEPIMNDEFGLIQWSSDIRGTLTFAGVEDVQLKQKSVRQIIKSWLSIEP